MRGARDSTNQRRVYVDRSERRSSKLDQSERSSHARYSSEGIKGTVPSFPSITLSRNDVDLCMKLEIVLHSEELSKNASVTCRGSTSSAISSEV